MSFRIRAINKVSEDEFFWTVDIHAESPREWDPNHECPPQMRAHFEQDLRDGLKYHTGEVFIAEDSAGKRVGMHWVRLQIIRNRKRGDITSLWVDPSVRRQGLAKALKEAGEKWFREQGADEVFTTVYFVNEKMLKLNLKLGFKPGHVEMFKKLS